MLESPEEAEDCRSESVTDQLIKAIQKLSNSQQRYLFREIRNWVKYDREYPRQNWQADITYADNSRLAHGMIMNISPGGLYLQPDSLFDVGQDVTLSFEHPLKEKQIKVNGTIVRSDQKGIGIKFDQSIGKIF